MTYTRTRALRQKVGNAPIAALLLVLVVIPSLVFYAGLSTSLALGTAIASALILATSLFVRRLDQTGEPLTLAVWSAITVFVVAAHALIAGLFQTIDAVRATTSLVPLLLLLAGGCVLSRMLRNARSSAVDRAVFICFSTLCVISVLPLLGIAPDGPGVDSSYVKPVFPFTEPSHFALIFIPMLMYCAVMTTGALRLLVLALGGAVALFLQNLTLVAGGLLVLCVCLRGLILPVLLAALALAASQLDLSYYADRLDFSGEVQNLSNLVYLQGWQLTFEALERSSGWGLGFQQLGLQGSDTVAAEIILALVGEYANILDGGFTFAKIVSEFGLLGLTLIALYLRATASAIRTLRTTARGRSQVDAADVFARAILVSYSIELFVRGAGYFTSSGLLLVASVMLLASRRSANDRALSPSKDPNLQLLPSATARLAQ